MKPSPLADEAGQRLTAAVPAYRLEGQRYDATGHGLPEAIAAAYAARRRPRCLCRAEGVEMYVARLGNGFVVKRMPNTGSQHAMACPSYEPPVEFSGLAQVLGTAIREDPFSGQTALRLDFSMSRITGRSTSSAAASVRGSVTSDGTKLSLRGLLHYLWDQAELTRWHPGFAGKRSWAIVRKHLLLAAENKVALGCPLPARLFIPEVFSVKQRDAINARRRAHWASSITHAGRRQHLMLMVAELKEFAPARHGYKAVLKHLPDHAFALDEQLYRRLQRAFESELLLWGSSDDLHLVMIATFALNEGGVPAVSELSLMPTTAQWLPIEDSDERDLLDELVRDGRCFVKTLRYNRPTQSRPLPVALLTDVGEQPTALYARESSGLDEAQVGNNTVNRPEPTRRATV